MPIEYRDLESGTAAGFWIRFVLGVLATWRVSHLLVSEDGPWEVIARLRRWFGSSVLGRLMDCFGCVSLWVAAPISFCVIRQMPELLLCWLALSGAAFLLEFTHAEPLMIERVANNSLQAEKEESIHGVLR